jgi:hypothetical protein
MPPLPSLFDWLRVQSFIYEEGYRIQNALFERLVAPAIRGAAGAPFGPEEKATTEAPAPDPREAEAVEVLRRAQLLVLRFPIAAQAAFAALVAEGRRFAATPEGAAWSEALASSMVLRRARKVWDAVSFSMFEENANTVLPSAYLEALMRVAKSTSLDGLLEALRRNAKEDGDGGPR